MTPTLGLFGRDCRDEHDARKAPAGVADRHLGGDPAADRGADADDVTQPVVGELAEEGDRVVADGLHAGGAGRAVPAGSVGVRT